MEQLGFIKDDVKDKKLRWDLLPLDAVNEIVKRFTHGAEKYAPDNWKKCAEPGRYIAALLRHLEAVQRGERIDSDSGLTHISAVAWNALCLVWLDLHDSKKTI